jgi:hypothetical protein
MSLSLVCSKCRSSYTLPDNMAGKSIKCKKCGQAIAAKPGGKNATGGSAYGTQKIAPKPQSQQGTLKKPGVAPGKMLPNRSTSPSMREEKPGSRKGFYVLVASLLLFLAGGGVATWYIISNLIDSDKSVARVDSTELATSARSTPTPPPATLSSIPPPPMPTAKAEPLKDVPKLDTKPKEPEKPKETKPTPPPETKAAPPEPKPAPPPDKPKEPEKPKEPADVLTKVLTEMDAAGKRKDGGAVVRSLVSLSQMDRDDKRSEEVAKAINPYLNPEWPDGWVNAEKALKVWVAPASIPALGKLLEVQNKDQSGFTMELLAKTKEASAAELIATRLERPDEQQDAAKHLESMGANAEKAWLAASTSGNDFARTEARKMLKELKTTDAAILEQASKDVKSNKVEHRQWGAEWLNAIAVDEKFKKQAIQAIEAVFLDNNPKVREESGKAAARWATTKDDLPTLIVALENNPSPAARTAILDVMAKFNDPRCGSVVAMCLPTERAQAAPILKAIGKPAERAVAGYSNHPDAAVREEVNKLLAEYKTDEAILVPIAVMDLQSTNNGIRLVAAERLAKLKPIEAHRADVIEAVKAFVKNPDGNTRAHGVRLLATWGTKEEVPYFLEMLDADPTRPLAMEALGVLKDPRGAEAVAKYLAPGNERPRAIASLKTMGPAAEDTLIGYLKDKDAAVLIEVCKLLNAAGTKKSLTPLRALGTDKNKQVVQAAGDAFKAITARGK